MASLADRILVTIDATSQGAVQELDKLQKSASKTDAAFDGMGKKLGVAGSTLKTGLVAGAAALVGTHLVSFLNESVDAFGDAAKAADELARASGGTVEEVSRMQAALKDAGVSAEASAGLLTKFTVNAGKNEKLLSDLGVSLKTNADGSKDYADGMVQAVDAINKIGDASQRGQAMVALFGKAGAKAFQDLADSGISLSESMKLVNKYQVFNAEDVRKAKAYDDAMDSLSASLQGVQFALGEALIPALTALADLVGGTVDAIMSIPGPVRDLAVAAALAAAGLAGMNKALAFFKSEKFGLMFVGMIDAIAPMLGAFAGVEGVAGKAGVAIRGLGSAFQAALVSAGPLIALIAAIEVAMNTLSEGKRWQTTVFDNASKSLADQAKILQQTDSVLDSIIHPNWGANTGDIKRVTDSWTDMANATLESADASDVQRAAAQHLLDVIKAGTLGTDEGTAAMQDYANAVNASAGAAMKAQTSQTGLNDLIAQGVTSGTEFAQALVDASDAQKEQNRITETSKGLMEAQADATWDAVDATLALFDKQYAARKSQRDYNEAIRDYNQASKEGFENADAQAQAQDDLANSAMDAAAAFAEQERQNALNNGTFLTAAEVTQKQIDKLKELALQPGLSPDVKTNIEGMITTLEGAQSRAAEGITVETDINLLTPDQVESKVSELQNRVRDAAQGGDWGLVDSLTAEIATLTTDKTVNVDTNTTYSPGGYNAVKARKDYLATNVSGTVNIDTTFTPDGYAALKARKDYLAQDRTAYIDIVLRGATQARSTLNGIAPAGATATGYAATAPQPVTNHWTVTINGASDPRATVRALERYARDNGRPSSVRVTA